ncbi:MAG: hypothetical protein [Caudoviricetes sp.]|nr:MAG: hypothetical protein [Caudoviricetes sp.]
MNDNFAEMFWILLLVAAVAGWAAIEGLIWIFHHVSFSFA